MAKKRAEWQVFDDELTNTLLVVRCRRHRLLALLDGTPEPIVVRATREPAKSRRVLDGSRVIDPDLGAGSEDWGEPGFDCPHHKSGHYLSGAKLRQVVDLQCRRGKVINVDIARVV